MQQVSLRLSLIVSLVCYLSLKEPIAPTAPTTIIAHLSLSLPDDTTLSLRNIYLFGCAALVIHKPVMHHPPAMKDNYRPKGAMGLIFQIK